ncbi:MAG: hypothetical protein ACLUVM_01795 [Blautia faecis]
MILLLVILGMSAATNARKEAEPAFPFGAAKTVFAVREIVS